MKKKKRTWLIIVIAVVAIIGVPLGINEAYKVENGYLTMWGAADVLSYYGMIIAAIGAAMGVYFSIRYSHKQYTEDKRRDVLPFFAINQLSQSRVNTLLLAFLKDRTSCETEEIEGLKYKEYLSNSIYFFVEVAGISYSDRMDDERRKKVEWDTDAMNELFGKTHSDKAIYIAHDLQNVGNGCAINTFLSIKSSSGKKIFSDTISVPVGEKVYFGLYIERNESLIGQYRIDLGYQDIFGNAYVQSGMVAVEKADQYEILCVREWPETGKPQLMIQEDVTNADA